MPPLLYYLEERQRFAAEYGEKLSDSDAQLLFDRLKAHYKFGHWLRFFGNRGGNCRIRMLTLPHNPSVAMLAHEVAHAIQHKRRRSDGKKKGWHTKEHTAIMGRVIAYIMAHKAAWKAQDARKDERQMDALESKRQHEAAQKALRKTAGFKLARLQERERKLLTKAKRTATLLKKVQKQMRYYEKRGAEMPSAAAEQPGIAEEIAAEVFGGGAQ